MLLKRQTCRCASIWRLPVYKHAGAYLSDVRGAVAREETFCFAGFSLTRETGPVCLFCTKQLELVFWIESGANEIPFSIIPSIHPRNATDMGRLSCRRDLHNIFGLKPARTTTQSGECLHVSKNIRISPTFLYITTFALLEMEPFELFLNMLAGDVQLMETAVHQQASRHLCGKFSALVPSQPQAEPWQSPFWFRAALQPKVCVFLCEDI